MSSTLETLKKHATPANIAIAVAVLIGLGVLIAVIVVARGGSPKFGASEPPQRCPEPALFVLKKEGNHYYIEHDKTGRRLHWNKSGDRRLSTRQWGVKPLTDQFTWFRFSNVKAKDGVWTARMHSAVDDSVILDTLAIRLSRRTGTHTYDVRFYKNNGDPYVIDSDNMFVSDGKYSCHGARTPGSSCCITCDEVIGAYQKRGWAYNKNNFEQCN